MKKYWMVAAALCACSNAAFAQNVQPQITPQAAPVAQEEPIDSVGGGAIPALVSGVETNGNITYMTGGVGDEDLEAIKANEAQFNVNLLLATIAGEYTSEVKFELFDAKGQPLLVIADAGPFVLLKLSPAAYQVQAVSVLGESKVLKFTVPAKGAYKSTIRFQ